MKDLSAINCTNSIGEVINLGSGFEISILDTVNLISEIMQEEIEIISDNKRKRPLNSEVERLYASNKKAKSILQWEPKFSGKEGFKKGLSETIDWFSWKKILLTTIQRSTIPKIKKVYVPKEL